MSLSRLWSWISIDRRSPARCRSRSRQYQLQFEILEDRCLLTTVTNLLNSGTGSLRDAIAAGGTVDFLPGLSGTIVLSGGQLSVSQNVTIQGPGAGLITVSGSNTFRDFRIQAGSVATITGLTIANGLDTAGGGGGGILVEIGGSLTLIDCVVTGNQVNGNGEAGGGINNNGGSLSAVRCVISGNQAIGTSADDGGILNSGTMSLSDCTIAFNQAAFLGGGIGHNGSSMVLTNCTISNNSARIAGGLLTNSPAALLTNCTITGNQASNFDGGIRSFNLLTLVNCTVAFNQASTAGGIEVAGGTVSLTNTIVAGNTAATAPDIKGTVTTAFNNLIGDSSGSSGLANGVNGNLVGSTASPINPLLGPLQFNGGPTGTLALLAGSPAIDAGTSAGAPSTDQRGLPRPSGSGVDIGAFELQVPAPSTSSVSFPIIAVGAGAGSGPEVKVFNAQTGSLLFDFDAYDPTFLGGVRVAVGDVNNDGTLDIITVPWAGGGPLVKVFSGKDLSLILAFNAYDPNFLGGTFLAAGDFNQDGFADIVTGPDAGGGPLVEVFSGKNASLLLAFNAYDPSFRGGVRVAIGDVNQDGFADIITAPGAGGGPLVEVFSGKDATLVLAFNAYDPNFRLGVFVAAGDTNGDGFVDVITAPDAGGGPLVEVFSGKDASPLLSFNAYDPTFLGGVRIGAVDVNHDGLADLLTGPGGRGGALINLIRGPDAALLFDFNGFDPAFPFGVFVAG